jgi:hypothetical protein
VPKRPAIVVALAFGWAAGGSTLPAEAGDITVFWAQTRPSEAWEPGYGAALSSTWFRYATLEAEVARIGGDGDGAGMTSFMGSALLSVPLSALTPYGGVGVGFFRQTLGTESDLGSLKALVLGCKLRLGGIIVLRGDYRRLDLSGAPLVDVDDRFAAGIGLAF